jgi:arylsulfatase A-like enzyme
MFVSDNGGLSAHGRGGSPHTHNKPLSSGKGSAHEGGVRVPMIVAWPGVTRPNSACHQYVIVEDFFPTILEIAGVQASEPRDGVSFVPLLRQRGDYPQHRSLVWHFPNHWGPQGPGIGPSSTIRRGDWKLIYYHADRSYELFNLAVDLSEERNLAQQNPDVRRQLAEELARYLQSVQAQMPRVKATGQLVPLPGGND